MTLLDVDARGTQHCETTALGVLLRTQGLDLSEPMLFGLGSGLSFVYWDSKKMAFPFLGGRVKPFDLTRNLASGLGLELVVRETSSPAGHGRTWQPPSTRATPSACSSTVSIWTTSGRRCTSAGMSSPCTATTTTTPTWWTPTSKAER